MTDRTSAGKRAYDNWAASRMATNGFEPPDDADPQGGDPDGVCSSAPHSDEGVVPRIWKATELNPAVQPRWLAKGRIQRGATNLLVGDEGIGKSLLWVWIVAAVTTGKPEPQFGIPARDPAPVILVCTEDDWGSTVRPRLEVAGADLDNISVICIEPDGGGTPLFPRDLFLISEADPKPVLVVVDAWLDTVSGTYNVKDPHSARLALHPWKELAVSTDAAVLLLTHTNRQGSGNARDRYGITGELRKKARVTLYAQADEAGRLVVGPEKMNNGVPVAASMFSILQIRRFDPTDDDDGTVPQLVHVGASDRTARQHVADSFEDEHGDDRSTLDQAVGWLESYLQVEGPQADSGEAKRLAAKNGITVRTLQRACKKLEIVHERTGFGKDTKVTWSLPRQGGVSAVFIGATESERGKDPGESVAPLSRQDVKAGVTEAQLCDQPKQGRSHQSRRSRQQTDTFVAPIGQGRCASCGWHVETQGHATDCATQQTSRRKREGGQEYDICMLCRHGRSDCVCADRNGDG